MGLVAAMEWLGRPYRLSRVEMPADMLTDDYARINPRRETPVLVKPDGSLLTETIAIVQWLSGGDVDRRISFAAGSDAADRLTQYIAFLNTGFTAAFVPYWAAMEAEDASEDDRIAWRRLGHSLVNDRHRKLEAMIGDTDYLLGDRPTLADAVFIGIARWADFHQAIDPADYPRITALKKGLAADPAVQFATAIEDGETPPGTGAMLGQVPLVEIVRDPG